ncbi:hypothetical protein AND_007705 [Anopheles darlingi]|uniref:Uncharacterized protein n=1 Tax=Anopheles darlingi TaxID=43151 RepID=W5JCV8_ANODA|nr:hypothetical protein AND_007705 [Anopheles darlingi]
MNKSCARCQKVVYPIEELKCLDKRQQQQEEEGRVFDEWHPAVAPAGNWTIFLD